MTDYPNLAASALSAYEGYKQNQADTSSARMADYYRGRANDMLAEAQAIAIMAMAEAIIQIAADQHYLRQVCERQEAQNARDTAIDLEDARLR